MKINPQTLKSIVVKFIKYCCVGFSGLAIDFFITWSAIEFGNLSPILANAIGFTLAALSNYVIASVFVFKNEKIKDINKLTIFFVVSLAGLLINSLLISLLINYSNLGFYVCKFIAIVATAIWNFAANFLVTFRKRRNKNVQEPLAQNYLAGEYEH